MNPSGCIDFDSGTIFENKTRVVWIHTVSVAAMGQSYQNIPKYEMISAVPA